ncbi:MAG: phage portal protein [Patescibacteria group bacterium]|nr:phage portal protein [Patescibacteria group bacterium]
MKLSFEFSRAKTGGELLKQNSVLPSHAGLIRKAQNGDGRILGSRKTRMYDAATTTNLNGDFPVSITSANAEILTSISASRARARRLVRDNPYASGIENTFGNNVAGEEPFRLEMKVGKYDADGKFVEETETNRLIEQSWREAGRPENCCASRNISRLELYHMAICSVIRDGGILFRHRRAYPQNKFNYALEPIEADRLDHFWNRPLNENGNEIQFSIEMDEWHAPVAYWILTRHPGDIFAYSNNPRYRERVPAGDVIAFFDLRKRAGQYVGMSRFASVIQRLHRMDQYDVAEMTAAIVSAIKVGFFTKTNTADQYTGDSEDENGLKFDKVEAGINFEELPDNYDLKQFDPKHPVEAYPAFTRQNLCSVAQGVGLSASTVGGDYSNMSFSTGRLEKLPERDTFRVLQEHTKKSFVHPHFNEWLKYAILSGSLKLPISRLEEFQNAAFFHAKRWPYINPLQDAQSDILRIEAGLDSRSRVIAESERGGDVEEVDTEQASDKAIDELHELDFSGSDPTTPTVKKGEPGQEDPSAEGVQPPA